MRKLGYQHYNEDGLSMLGQSGMNHWVRPTQGVDLVGFHCETSHRIFFKNHHQGGIFSWSHCTSFGGAPPFFRHLLVALEAGGQPGGSPGSGDKPAWGAGYIKASLGPGLNQGPCKNP